MSTPPPGSHRYPARKAAPVAAYHDDLPDIFEPLPFDPHVHWAIDHMGIETPGELIDDAPVVLHGDGDLRRAHAARVADDWTSLAARSHGKRGSG